MENHGLLRYLSRYVPRNTRKFNPLQPAIDYNPITDIEYDFIVSETRIHISKLQLSNVSEVMRTLLLQRLGQLYTRLHAKSSSYSFTRKQRFTFIFDVLESLRRLENHRNRTHILRGKIYV
jgi:hypothetical protein